MAGKGGKEIGSTLYYLRQTQRAAYTVPRKDRIFPRPLGGATAARLVLLAPRKA